MEDDVCGEVGPVFQIERHLSAGFDLVRPYLVGDGVGRKDLPELNHCSIFEIRLCVSKDPVRGAQIIFNQRGTSIEVGVSSGIANEGRADITGARVAPRNALALQLEARL